jgi:hypothetical protein
MCDCERKSTPVYDHERISAHASIREEVHVYDCKRRSVCAIMRVADLSRNCG